MNKKILAITLVFLLLFSSMSIADNEENIEDVANRLISMGIVTGYVDGSLKLEKNISRAEFATVAVRLIARSDEEKSYRTSSSFNDLKDSHWALGYINIAIEEGLFNGYPDGSFRPEDNISYGEVLAVMVRLLGHEDSINSETPWPLNYINKASELGVNNSILVADSNATRGKVFTFIDNSLMVELNKAY